MEKNISNDMLLATMANPTARTYDFITNNIKAENTQLLKKEDYINKDYIQEQFKTEDGKFDDKSFDIVYNAALYNINSIADESAVKDLSTVEYNITDWTRPIDAVTRSGIVEYTKDFNPHKTLYSRDGVNTRTENDLSLREIAQQGRIYDIETGKWSERSANDLGLFKKFFGDTLVYAQWDEDGVHKDPYSGNMVNHYKGEWKSDEFGQLYLEKLGNREVYGKQVVNPTDLLTTDGSIFNKFDFLDSDGREKSIGGVAVKTIAEIAPLLIPGFNTYYGGTRAVIGLAAVMPTFYKSLEGLLLGGDRNYGSDPISRAEGWLAKFTTSSTSDKGSEGLFNVEQMSDMVSSIFSQIYEQRAMAGISKYIVRADKMMDAKTAALQYKASSKALEYAKKNGIDFKEALAKTVAGLPELQAAYAKQSQMSKAFSLGYMALTSTSQIYGEALEGGYDRRTAGFASLLAAGGQYGLMMNNRMGDWFLDKTTGYTAEVNKSLVKQSVQPWVGEIAKVFNTPGLSKSVQMAQLAKIVSKVKGNFNNMFKSSSIVGEAMWKNSVIEGIEEVTEQIVEDASKAIVDVMSYFGWTKKKGSFNTVERYQSGEAFEEYLANFVGGVIGGSLFELERSVISPWMTNTTMPDQNLTKSIYELLANGHKDDVIRVIKSESRKLANDYVSYVPGDVEGTFLPKDGVSQGDLVSQAGIKMVEHIEGLLGSEGLILSDDELINKILRNDLYVKELEATIPKEGGLGLERIILDDFKTNAVKLIQAKEKVNQNEKAPESARNTEGSKVYQETLKKHRKILDSILAGEKNMEYFDQMSYYLNPDFRDLFGSLDRETFVQSRYKTSYNTLPEDGTGLTKQKATEEWTEYLESEDIVAKLKTMTAAYKKFEIFANPYIAKHIDTGYNAIRKNTQDLFLDLDKTIKNFNTSDSEEDRVNALNLFIKINEQIERLGGVKTLPWDSYRADLGEKLFTEGLVKKQVVDSDGKVTLEDYTDAELNTDLGQGETLKDLIKKSFNEVTKIFPASALNMDTIISSYNNSLATNNQTINDEIAKINMSSKSPEEKTVEINNLKAKLSNHFIQDISETTGQKNLKAIYEAEFEADKNNLLEGKDDYFDDYNEKVVRKHMYVDGSNFITLEGEVTKINKDLSNWADLSAAEKIELFKSLQERGLIENLFEQNEGLEGFKDSYNSYLTELLAPEGYDTDFENTLFSMLDADIKSTTQILTDTSIQTKIQELNALKETYNKKVLDSRPEFFKMHNFAFDYLLESLKDGVYDLSLYNMAKEMFEDNLNSLSKKMMPGDHFLSLDDMVHLSELSSGDLATELYELMNEDIMTPLDYGDTLQDLMDISSDFGGNELLTRIITNNYSPETTLDTIADGLDALQDSVERNKDQLNSLVEFTKLDLSKAKEDPLIAMLKDFEVHLNSSKNSKVSRILDILARENLEFKKSSGADSFINDDVRISDIEQALGLLDLFGSVINSMSTTELFGETSGFLAMRQRFAKIQGIKDAVLDLKTISSEEASVMSKDLNVLKTRLNFMLELSAENKRKTSKEQERTEAQANLLHISAFRSLADKDALIPLFPADFNTILNSTEDPKTKILKLETAFFNHNKENKIDAFSKILKFGLTNVNSSEQSYYTSETTLLSSYTKAVYFATVLENRADDHIKKQHITLSGAIDKAPFYLQQYASRVSEASITNPELFALISNFHKNVNKVNGNFLTMITGGTGTGKTTVAIASTIDRIRQTNSTSNIWLAGPSQDQANKLHDDTVKAIGSKDISFTTLNADNLFNQLGEKIVGVRAQILSELKDPSNANNTLIKVKNGRIVFEITEGLIDGINYKNLPNLLVFDEATHLSQAEIQLLQLISVSSYNRNSHNFMKVLLVGDPTQMGYKTKVGEEYIEYNMDGIDGVFTPYLSTSIRSSNPSKRINHDLVHSLVKISVEHIKENTIDIMEGRAEDYSQANLKTRDYLNAVGNETSLQHYKDAQEFQGDLINTSYKDIQALKSIVGAIKKAELEGLDKISIGVLTATGEISPELENALIDAGFTTDMIKQNIITKTPDNVQGSEFEYFIFDMAQVPAFDKIKDTMRAVYTWMSRSRAGTIIYDTEGRLSKELNITNGKEALYPLKLEVLDTNLIKELKDKRMSEINELVNGEMEISDDSNFKWRVGEFVGEEELDPKDTPESVQIPSKETYITPAASTEKAVYREGSDFGVEVHSFYNNAGARLVYEDNVPVSLEVHPSKVRVDLNGHSNLTDSAEIQKVITQWKRLTSALFRNKETVISTYDYADYFNHIFGTDKGNVTVELVVTASLYSEEYNTPFQKQLFDATETLKEGDVFRNVMAKLTLGDNKVQYVTLATLAKNETFLDPEKGMKNYWGTASKADVEAKLLETTKTIKKTLEKQIADGGENLLVTAEIDQSEIDIITSTRLIKSDKNKFKFKLSELEQTFPGIYTSEIRIFPASFNAAKKLLSRYQFGGEVSDERVRKLLNIDKNNKRLGIGMGNKPYIVVSFANDVEGIENGKRTAAKLIPISADGRSLEVAMQEVRDLKAEADLAIKNHYLGVDTTEGLIKAKENFIFPEILNVKAETLFDKNQILDILLEWHNTKYEGDDSLTLLDLLTESIGIERMGFSDPKNYTMLDLLDGFKKVSGDDTESVTTRKFKEVIDLVKQYNDGRDKAEVKKDIRESLIGKTGWEWNFHNLLAYQHIIDKETETGLISLLKQFTIEDIDDFNTANYSTFVKYSEALIEPLRKLKLYYSIPIETRVGETRLFANHLISGENGFSKESFGDRFFINVVPESERAIIPLPYYLEIDPKKAEETTVEPDTDEDTDTDEGEDGGIDTSTGFLNAFKEFAELSNLIEKLGDKGPAFNSALESVYNLYLESVNAGENEAVSADKNSQKTALNWMLRKLNVQTNERGVITLPTLLAHPLIGGSKESSTELKRAVMELTKNLQPNC